MRNFLWLLLLVTSSSLAAPSSRRLKFPPIQSSAQRVTLVELYTSEGCSSCPVADYWLSNLKTQPGLWKQFIPIAFHVTFWDYLGWRDKWASPYFSKRLRTYAKQWSLDRPYTPTLSLNGEEWKEWRQQKTLPEQKKENAGVLSLYPRKNQQVFIEYAPELREDKWQANVALIGSGITSAVKSGENKGKALNHDFVVLSHHSAVLKEKKKKFSKTIRVAIPSTLPNSLALVAWVARPGALAPIQSVGAPISTKWAEIGLTR